MVHFVYVSFMRCLGSQIVLNLQNCLSLKSCKKESWGCFKSKDEILGWLPNVGKHVLRLPMPRSIWVKYFYLSNVFPIDAGSQKCTQGTPSVKGSKKNYLKLLNWYLRSRSKYFANTCEPHKGVLLIQSWLFKKTRRREIPIRHFLHVTF